MDENYKCPLCGERFESEEIVKNHMKSCFDSYHSSNLNQTSIDPAANGVITSQPIAANATSFGQQPIASRNAPDEYVGCCYGCCSDEDGDAYTSDHQRGMTTSSSDHVEPLGGGGGWFSSSGDNGGANDNDCKWDSGGGGGGCDPGGGGDSGGGGCGGDSGGGDCGGGGGSSSCD